jgi:2-oxoglutarate dehydrogenase E1 component
MSDQSTPSTASVYTAYQGNSYLFGGNAPYVEEMYENYLANPGSVPDNWRDYFDALQHVPAVDGSNAKDVPHLPVVNAFAERAKQGGTRVVQASGADSEMGRKRTAVQQLIAAYRNVGQRWADLDPLKRTEREKIPELDPSFYGFSDADQETVFNTSNTFFGKETMSLRELINALRETYCGTIGAEYMYITDQNKKRWWQQKLESIRSKPNFTAEKKKHILDRLTAAEGLERFLHTKYVGQKRFSLEGGESFIASMDELIQQAGAKGVQEIVIGMAHRGRLNVLVNSLGKMPADLFAEFDHTAKEELPAGDVKYHQGFSSDVTTPGGPVHLSLAFNPSHLEIVNPVVEGSVRARMDRRADPQGKQVLPVQVHGDAAFAGQGVVMETLALAETRGYFTGGTVHIVINNQIGFTTSDPRDSRSTLYCSDVVKMIEAPVLHVNGDDPEAVVLATQIALDYRMEFAKDVVVDIVCFRKLGHNEQDTPSLTQPLMYKKIAAHPGTRKLYADKLAAQGLGETLGDDMVKAYRGRHGRGQAHGGPGADQLQEQVRGGLEPVPQPQVDGRGRHGDSDGRVETPGRKNHHGARQLHAAPAGQEGAGRPRGHGPWRGQCGLGHGRTHGLCVAGGQRLPGASVGRRLRPWHLHPPPCRVARPEPREVGHRHLPRCRTWPRTRLRSW